MAVLEPVREQAKPEQMKPEQAGLLRPTPGRAKTPRRRMPAAEPPRPNAAPPSELLTPATSGLTPAAPPVPVEPAPVDPLSGDALSGRPLVLAPELSLPLEAVTETFAILAKRGSGKTYAAAVLVEEMLKAGQTVVVADPVGVWWGLRSGAGGTGPGLPVAILGGDHADAPLAPEAGAAAADLAAEERLSLVLDLSHFTPPEQTRFMTAFAERLYRRNRLPLHLVLDEADQFVPQVPEAGQQPLLWAMNRIVRLGRARGLGVTLISQRPAVLAKNVLTQAEVLIALRLTSPQDRKAVEAWVSAHGAPELRQEMLASLASLPVGTAWVWSPGWLDVLVKARVRRRETFDSSATPKVGQAAGQGTMGQARTEPAALAPADLDRLRARLALVEEAALEDAEPAELRQCLALAQERVAALEKQAQAAVPPVPKTIFQKTVVQRVEVVKEVVKTVEVPALEAGQAGQLQAIASELTAKADALRADAGRMTDVAGSMTDVAREILLRLDRISPPATLSAPPEPAAIEMARPEPATFAAPPPSSGIGAASGKAGGGEDAREEGTDEGPGREGPATADGQNTGEKPSGEKMPLAERKVLTALARFPDGRRKNQVALLTGYAVSGGGFNNALSALRSKAWIAGRDVLTITAPGSAALGRWEPLPAPGPALLEHWAGHLGKAERAVLRALAQAHPGALTKERLGAAAGYEPTGGGFNNALSRLRTLALIEGRGELRASDTLCLTE